MAETDFKLLKKQRKFCSRLQRTKIIMIHHFTGKEGRNVSSLLRQLRTNETSSRRVKVLIALA